MLERQTSRISDEKLVELFSLGNLYMSDFIDDYSSSGVKVPLTMTLDIKSGLLQLKHTAPFDKMYPFEANIMVCVGPIILFKARDGPANRNLLYFKIFDTNFKRSVFSIQSLFVILPRLQIHPPGTEC